MATETLPQSYTNETEVKRVFGTTGVLLRGDLDGDGTLDPLVMTDAINYATDYVNQYVMGLYKPSDLVNNLWVRMRTTWIAAHYLAELRGNPSPLIAQFDRATQELENVRRGKFQIPRLGWRNNQIPALSNYTINDRYRISKARVEPTISTGGNYPGQDLNPNFPDVI